MGFYEDIQDYADYHDINTDGQQYIASINSTFRAAFTYAAHPDPVDPDKMTIDWKIYHADKSAFYKVTETLEINDDGSVTRTMGDMEGRSMISYFERGVFDDLHEKFNSGSGTSTNGNLPSDIEIFAKNNSLPIGGVASEYGQYSVEFPDVNHDRLAETSSCSVVSDTNLVCITNVYDEGMGTGLDDPYYKFKMEMFSLNKGDLTLGRSAAEYKRDLKILDKIDPRVSDIKEYHPQGGGIYSLTP
jgi:hypothetical protein